MNYPTAADSSNTSNIKKYLGSTGYLDRKRSNP